MGGESKQTQTSTSSTTPYAPAQGTLDSLLAKLGGKVGSTDLTGAETGALDTLQANASKGNPFAGDITSVARGMLSGGGANANDAGISSALTDYKGLLSPYASGSQIGENSALKGYLDTISNDVQSRVNGMFAGAGRDLSGANQHALARGIAEGVAPVMAQQFNLDTDRALGAAKSIYDASNTSYGLLNNTNQQRLANQVQGIDVGGAALDANNWGANQTLAIEAARRGIPIENLQTLLGSVLPTAAAFGTQNGRAETTQKDDPLKTILGAVIGGGTLLAKMSDARVKEDISRVGYADNGLPIYLYRYKGSPRFEIGLMAQDVEKVAPQAVEEVDGLKLVNYAKALH